MPYICTAWPTVVRPTMETYDCILDLEEPWKSQSKIDDEVLQMYMDPVYMPKAQGRQGHAPKKTRHDVEQYRLRFPESSFGCIMANYGSHK